MSLPAQVIRSCYLVRCNYLLLMQRNTSLLTQPLRSGHHPTMPPGVVEVKVPCGSALSYRMSLYQRSKRGPGPHQKSHSSIEFYSATFDLEHRHHHHLLLLLLPLSLHLILGIQYLHRHLCQPSNRDRVRGHFLEDGHQTPDDLWRWAMFLVVAEDILQLDLAEGVNLRGVVTGAEGMDMVLSTLIPCEVG